MMSSYNMIFKKKKKNIIIQISLVFIEINDFGKIYEILYLITIKKRIQFYYFSIFPEIN